jgi:hypothetical protein
MAESALSMLGITEETIEAVEPESVYEGSTRPAGLYKATVDKAYVRKTDSGASMLEIDFKMEDGSDFHYSNCVKSGDSKGNKTTYTSKSGKEVPLPGVVELSKFLTAIDSIKASAVEGQVVHKDNKITALAFQNLQGKKLTIGINQEESFYQGDVLTKNNIKYWLDENGENSAGDNLKEKVTESLEKHPVKKYRPKAGTTAPAAGTTTTSGSENGGW